MLWLVGNGLFDTLLDQAEMVCMRLWLVGNGLFDTLELVVTRQPFQLWLVGNGLFDTLRAHGGRRGPHALAGRERPL